MSPRRADRAGKFAFEWNDLADQPHNVAPRSERRRHHFAHAATYLALLGSNLVHGGAAFRFYRRNRRTMYANPVLIRPDMFAVSVSPAGAGTDEILGLLAETGVRQTLFRVPSWERDKLRDFEAFARRLSADGFETVVAILQRREDVHKPDRWASFLDEAFARLGPWVAGFEIGHAWNRTKWGIWDHTEYVRLARAAATLRRTRGVRLIGPAVIDFEFHLYPPVLRAVEFDVVSTLLYVDRVGAPENAQFGWTAEKKFAVFQALAESGAGRRPVCWVTEVNWPLAGTGPYSPASGRPNVGQEDQADYLVRYEILALTSGLIDRVYWWQLAAPGYGLVDNRETPARRRPAFAALRTMVRMLSGAVFVRRERPAGGNAFYFEKDGAELAAVWTNGMPFDHEFGRPVAAMIDRDGEETASAGRLRIDGRPRYVVFRT